jgi:dynein heavy chain
MAEKADDLDKRLAILIEDETRTFYFGICRGLFEVHKLLYSFLNASSILRQKGDINVDEWNFYLRGSPTDFTKHSNSIDYINVDTFYGLMGLEEAHINFRDIVKSFNDPTDKISWKDIMSKDEAHLVEMPAIYEDRLTNF